MSESTHEANPRPNTHRASYDLAVCGGGVIGLTIAFFAAKRRLSVVVFDKGELGGQSSWAGAGILPASPNHLPDDAVERLRFLSHQAHADLSSELLSLTGIDNGFRRTGGIHLANTLAESATLAAQESWWQDHGIEFEVLSSNQLYKREPSLCRDRYQRTGRAWFLPGECQIRNPWHLKALIAGCEKLQVEFRANTPVLGFKKTTTQVEAIQTPSGTFVADKICLTGGAWTPELTADLNLKTGIFPVRGQMILVQTQKTIVSHILNEGHRYIVPRTDGKLLIGSCEEEVGYENTTTNEMLSQLGVWAAAVVPSIQNMERIGAWSGLRPGSFDGLPYMGKVPNLDNAFIAAGHFRHGLHWSTATAELILQLMQGEPTRIPLSPFDLNRGRHI